MDFETFASKRGASRQGFGEAGVHKRSRHISDKQWSRIIKYIKTKDDKLAIKRDQIMREYVYLMAKRVLRPLTRKEKLLQTASGHPDNSSTRAARRVLTKQYKIPPSRWKNKMHALTAHDIEPDELPCGCKSYYEPMDQKSPDQLRLVIRVDPKCSEDRNKVGKDVCPSVIYRGPVNETEWADILREFKNKSQQRKAAQPKGDRPMTKKKKKKVAKKLTASASASATAAPAKATKKAPAKKKAKAPAKAKNKLSAPDAAASVLKGAPKPLKAGELAERMKKAGLWSTNAPTPANTIHAALSTEIKKKGAKSRFTLVKGKGFTLRSGTTASPKAKKKAGKKKKKATA